MYKIYYSRKVFALLNDHPSYTFLLGCQHVCYGFEISLVMISRLTDQLLNDLGKYRFMVRHMVGGIVLYKHLF